MLTKSRNRLFSGVGGGLARVSPLAIAKYARRLGLATLFTGGAAILAYIVLAFAMPPPRTFNPDDYREHQAFAYACPERTG